MNETWRPKDGFNTSQGIYGGGPITRGRDTTEPRPRTPERVGLADGEVTTKSVRPSHERGDWAVYAFNVRKGDWETQPELIGVSLEVALTSALRWKDQGQNVRIETIPA